MTDSQARGRPSHPDILTPGEWRIAEGIRHGLSNPQIARRQQISVNAVTFHVSNILSKLSMNNRAEIRQWDGIAASSSLKRKASVSGTSQIGTIGQIARTVSNIEEARIWYRSVLGLEPLIDAGTLAFFACGGIRLMLSQGDANAESILYFRVDNLHEEFERVTQAGAKVASAPHRIHTHEDGSEEWMAFIEDNDGRPLALMAKSQPTNSG